MKAAARDPEPDLERPSLTAQVGWTLSGNVGYAICQWGMLIALAKSLPAAMVGQFALGLAIANPVFMFTNLQLRSIQATRASGAYEFRDYLGIRLVSASLSLVVIAGVCMILGLGRTTLWIVLSVGFAKALEAIGDVVYGHLQHAEAMNRIALSMLARGFLSLSLLVILILATHDLLWGIGALVLGSLVVLVAYDLPNARAVGHSLLSRAGAKPASIRPRWSAATWSGIVAMGLPLGLASLLLAVAANTPRIYLERLHGAAALGYFSALAYPSAAFTILLSALGQAATPRMAASYVDDRPAYWRLVSRMSLVPILAMGAVALGALALGPRILALLYRREYAEHFGVFLVLLAAGATWSMASVMGFAATASRRLRRQAIAALGIAGISVLLSAWLVPAYGGKGAAYAMTLSGFAALLIYGGLFLSGPDPMRDVSQERVRSAPPIRGPWSSAEAESEVTP
jgi:O-antigen/teichoic acid export membrane protein